ncbi:hypothetical protein PG987_007818 [Apiospora arundinis]
MTSISTTKKLTKDSLDILVLQRQVIDRTRLLFGFERVLAKIIFVAGYIQATYHDSITSATLPLDPQYNVTKGNTMKFIADENATISSIMAFDWPHGLSVILADRAQHTEYYGLACVRGAASRRCFLAV